MTHPDIALVGYAQSGKDSIANHLVSEYGHKRVAFADPVRDMALKLNPILDLQADDEYDETWEVRLADQVRRTGWDYTKRNYPEVREFLQRVGQTMRYEDEAYWLNIALRKMDRESMDTPIVVTDVRYDNEYEELRSRGFLVTRVDRPGVGPANDHVSESLAERVVPDIIIDNCGDLANLAALVDRLVSCTTV